MLDRDNKNRSYLENEQKLLKLQENNKKIGIMGGTFDPIHYGHLAMAEFIRQEYKLDKILFIPSGNPPHKRSKIADKIDRYEMCLLATCSNENFVVSDIEIKRDKKTYTIDTLRQLKKTYTKSEINFIIGADAICDIEMWKDVDENFKLASFIATTRPGISEEKTNQKIEELVKKYNATIHKVHAPSLDISSTYIRDRVGKNKSIKYVTPELVEGYIYNKDLYRNGE